MDMKKINSGKLRTIGYDARARMLQVQLDTSNTLQYSGGEDVWPNSAAPAQFGVFIATTSKRNSPLSKFQVAHLPGRIRLMTCLVRNNGGAEPFRSVSGIKFGYPLTST